MVPSWADQLLPQLLMEQFDTLPIQCRHIEHMHEGVYNFCLHRIYRNLLFKTTDSKKLKHGMPLDEFSVPRGHCGAVDKPLTRGCWFHHRLLQSVGGDFKS